MWEACSVAPTGTGGAMPDGIKIGARSAPYHSDCAAVPNRTQGLIVGPFGNTLLSKTMNNRRDDSPTATEIVSYEYKGVVH